MLPNTSAGSVLSSHLICNQKQDSKQKQKTSALQEAGTLLLVQCLGRQWMAAEVDLKQSGHHWCRSHKLHNAMWYQVALQVSTSRFPCLLILWFLAQSSLSAPRKAPRSGRRSLLWHCMAEKGSMSGFYPPPEPSTVWPTGHAKSHWG